MTSFPPHAQINRLTPVRNAHPQSAFATIVPLLSSWRSSREPGRVADEILFPQLRRSAVRSPQNNYHQRALSQPQLLFILHASPVPVKDHKDAWQITSFPAPSQISRLTLVGNAHPQSAFATNVPLPSSWRSSREPGRVADEIPFL